MEREYLLNLEKKVDAAEQAAPPPPDLARFRSISPDLRRTSLFAPPPRRDLAVISPRLSP